MKRIIMLLGICFCISSIFFDNSFPRRFLATIRLSSSNNNVKGILRTPYTRATSEACPFKSEPFNQGNPSSMIACTHLDLSSSKDTPNTSRPLSRYLLYNRITLGFSARQGPHHDAQKSTNFALALIPCNETGP